ncbi:AMP-binding protein [Longispora fulva]|uniref:Acyl-CoA synthetase (AMP-forming)/AMP-acid ligase II n=1 Tax=Longispora fulva TaxID=619741 RepID=A0A8J7KZP6_9ACTN|nr:AMP-binding protein [Longispora fulva]MBG6141437.1 acyl-CoA synthetase (AMP-forming)/AMP-acid ligase II [Longispora fulva]
MLDLFARYGEAEAIVDERRRISYTDLRAEILTMAATLHHHGMRPGLAVGILAGNPAETIVLQFAVHLLGGRTAWVAPNAPATFRDQFLTIARVDAFVYETNAYVDFALDMARSAAPLPVFCLGGGGLGPDLGAGDRIDRIEDLPFTAADVATEPEALFQTGGTTGQPKLVHHRQRFFVTALRFAEQYLEAGEHPMKHLAMSGYWHVSAQMPGHMCLFTGGSFHMQDGFDIAVFFDTIAAERITDTLIPPPLFGYILDHQVLEKADCSSLLRVNIGGSSIAPTRLAQAIRRLGPVLRPAYGMSEAPIITAYQNIPDDPAVLASVGQPYGDLSLEIRDPDGAPVPTGGTGEVWVTGGVMMDGYWGQPELTAETLVDGWLRTGDVGYLDQHGNLFLVDRVKDMILTGWGSSNVFARPIEDALATHPDVRAAAVVGVPSDRYGEAVHAFVVRAPGSTVTADDLRAVVVDRLNELWSPAGVDFVDALPLTGASKVDKKALRERYVADLAAAS